MSANIHFSVPFWLSLALVLAAVNTPGAGSPATPAEEFKAIVAEYNKAQEEFSKIISKAKNEAEQQKAFEKYPQPAKYAGRLLKLAEKSPKDPAALDALIWIVSGANDSPEADTALKLLTEQHVGSDKIGSACQSVVDSQSSRVEVFLRAVLEKNSHREVLAKATISLGRRLKDRKAESEAEKLFERVVEKFADIKGYERTLGEEARTELFELR
ncbi:MAG TPA: hypothetical protein VGK40_06715, partial [Verrucomicrobiae bacterium]